MDGKNIGDYVDADILEKLQQLEQEEEMLDQAEMDDEEELERERMLTDDEHHGKMKSTVRQLHQPQLEGARKDFEKKGIDTAFLDKLAQQNQEKTDKAKKRRRYSSDHDMEVEDVEPRSRSRSKIRNMSRSRSRGASKAELTPKEQVMERLFKKVQRSRRNEAKAGDGDTKIDVKKLQHLYTGKSGIGKKDRR